MRPLRLAMSFAAAVLAAVAIPATGYGAPPANDDFASAAAVTAMPFSDTVTLAEATTEPGEPAFYSVNSSVWYTFTAPDDAVVRVEPSASFYYYAVNVYRADGAGMGSLTWLGGNLWSPVVFNVTGGSKYYVQTGSYDGFPINPWDTLRVDLSVVPPPGNDDFADATPVGTLPFADTRDVTGATIEAGEPTSGCYGDFAKSVWYAFTPATSGSYTAGTGGLILGSVNVYTGTSLGDLTRVSCGGAYFRGEAGTTYYVQAGTWYASGSLETRVDRLPPPAVGFIWGPGYPSSFDMLTFQGTYLDPVGIDSWAWDFGDGATATGSTPQHRFGKDGNYDVRVRVTTPDGRANENTQTVKVETHDVSILWFSTPGKGRVGRPSTIEVGLGNVRYPERVQIDIAKSTPGGSQLIATSTRDVPVLARKKASVFAFEYTFTEDDLAVGKVTFQVTATILGNRPAIDAFPADNTATSAATQVSR